MLKNPLNRFSPHKVWLNWNYVLKDGKRTKVPMGSTTDPLTWKKLDELTGKRVGIVFTDGKLLGIDIDNCLEGNEIVHEDKEKIVQLIVEANTYVEISPSGKGLHLFLEIEEELKLTSNKHAPFEAYTRGRFFTVTWKSYKEAKEIRLVTKEEAIRILNLTGFDWVKEKESSILPTSSLSASQMIDDEVLLDKMFSTKNGKEIRKLYNGDVSAYRDDESSADMALCAHLAFWTVGNPAQMERMWLASPLGQRGKTQNRKDYRDRTIAGAIKNCLDFYKAPSSTPSSTATTPSTVLAKDDKLVFLQSSEIESKPIEWLWKGKIAKGKLTLIAGDPGLGKSQVTISIAAKVSKGDKFPGKDKAPCGRVLFFSAEDDPADTINPRLIAAGADLSNINIFSATMRGGKERFFEIDSDADLLERAIKNFKDVQLIVIDPITAFSGKTDTHVNAEVRGMLSKLSVIASRYNVAILVVTHLNKTSGASPMNKITGSLAFVAAARAAFIVVRDSDDEMRRLFLPVKNNIASDTSGFAFSLEGYEIKTKGEPIGTSRVVWEEEPITASALDIVKEQSRAGVDKRSVQWMEDFLAKFPDGIGSNEVLYEARRNGISRATAYRICEELMIDKIDAGGKKPKIWKLVFNEKTDLKDKDISADDINI